jgi:ATP synthase protein I
LTFVNFLVDFEKSFTYVALGLLLIIISRNFGGKANRFSAAVSGFGHRGNHEAVLFFPLDFSLQKNSEDDRYSVLRRAGLLTTVPFLLAASPIIGFFMGRFLDIKLGTEPIFSIIFLILGFIAGAIQVAKVVRLANRESDREE